jgi:hypothetical protein
MTTKGIAVRFDLTSGFTSPILCPQERKVFGGPRGRYEHSSADSDRNTPCDVACHCNDEVMPKKKSLRPCSDDFECRINILKNAVRRLERAVGVMEEL